MLNRGDYLNYIGIAVLASTSIACFAGIAPLLFRQKRRAYAAIAALEALILILAASGVLTAGH